MKWGETQNLISVIIGLNVAYYAFKDIRTPRLTSFGRDVTDLKEYIYKDMKDLQGERKWAMFAGEQSKIPDSIQKETVLNDLWTKVMFLDIDVSAYVRASTSHSLETKFGLPAIAAAVLATMALTYSTIAYEELISSAIFWTIVLAGFAPTAILLALNYLLVWGIKSRGFQARYDDIFKRHTGTRVSAQEYRIIAEANAKLRHAEAKRP